MPASRTTAPTAPTPAQRESRRIMTDLLACLLESILLDRAQGPAGVEADRVRAEDGRPPRLAGGRHRVGGEPEVMVVGGARERPVVVVVPGHLSQAVVDAHDDVGGLGGHAIEVRDAT